MAGPPSTAHPSTLTSPPDPDHHAVPDPRRANFHHLRDTTRQPDSQLTILPAVAQAEIPQKSGRWRCPAAHPGPLVLIKAKRT
jgi:hypothetical protein